MSVRERVTGVVLCGGEARRMSGVEKPLQLLHGKPLVQHVRERLVSQVAQVVIVANRQLDAYRKWADTVVADTIIGAGPLGGVAAAAEVVDTPYLFCCPGDAPFLDTTLVERLASHLDSTEEAMLAIPNDGERTQHLFMLARTGALRNSLPAYLERGERSVHGFVSSVATRIANASDIANSFLNINTHEDLHAAVSRNAHGETSHNNVPVSVEHP